MLFELQFPICDARGFHPDPDLRRVLPDWPNPTTDIRPQFVHFCGRAVERRREADQAWPDEMKFCKAERALRFSALERSAVGTNGDKFHLHCAFRRLFCDGRAIVRIEVGLTPNPRRMRIRGWSSEQILTAAAAALEIPTTVPQVLTKKVEDRLLRQGPALARLYADATVASKSTEKRVNGQRLVESGNPILVIEVDSREADLNEPPAGFVAVDPTAIFGAKLFFGRIRTRSGIVGTWLLQGDSAKSSKLRSLRLCLMRLHAEQEALDLVLKQIQRGRLLNPPTKTVVDRLDTYFNDSTKLINRAAWGEIRQSAILDAFDAADQVTLPANRKNLVDRYDGARNQVWKKVDDYQMRRAAARAVTINNFAKGSRNVEKQIIQSGTGNTLIVADYMKDVTNSVITNLKDSSAPDDLRALVTNLTDQINGIAQKADPAQVQKMGKNLKKLSEEIADPEPDRAWYEVSLKGLKEAAEAVGAIAEPILKTVKSISLFLLGA